MSVETSAENQICQNCGANIRSGALFCYNCGSSIKPDMAVSENTANGGGDEVSSKRRAAVKRNGGNPTETEKAERAFAAKPIAKPLSEDLIKPVDKPFKDLSKAENKAVEIERAEVKNKKMVVEKETVLKTAAVVRRQAKPPLRKNVEYIWEQPQSSVNIWFLAAAIVLTLFAVGALLAMLYLH